MYTVHVHIYIYDHICISRWSTIQESRFVKLPEGKDTYIVMPQLALLVNVTQGLGAELMVDITYAFFYGYKRTQNWGPPPHCDATDFEATPFFLGGSQGKDTSNYRQMVNGIQRSCGSLIYIYIWMLFGFYFEIAT